MDRVEISIAGIVLAAGSSRRMMQPKLVLPWGDTTVIGQVVSVLSQVGIAPIVVVTGAHREQVKAALQGFPVQIVYNPQYQQDEMIYSLQAGMEVLPRNADALLIALGDQPHISAGLVRKLIEAFQDARNAPRTSLAGPSLTLGGVDSPKAPSNAA